MLKGTQLFQDDYCQAKFVSISFYICPNFDKIVFIIKLLMNFEKSIFCTFKASKYWFKLIIGSFYISPFKITFVKLAEQKILQRKIIKQ